MKYSFFYDETEHSRKINIETITADNYYDNFCATIIGWKKEDESRKIKAYEEFEAKYEYRKVDGELKSHTMKQKDFRHGFATLNKHTIEFYEDLLTMYDEKIVIFISVFSKVEYVIQQIFRDVHNTFLADIDFMKYSIIKAILVYHPRKVIEALYKGPENFIDELRSFLIERIELNKENLALKERENIVFQQVLLLIPSVRPIINLKWEYNAAFNGFAKLLREINIRDYDLVVDKEGNSHSTANAAEKEGLTNVKEENSREYVGIRMADMLIGLVSKLMQSLNKALACGYSSGNVDKHLLESGWFVLDERQLALYKKLHQIICVNNKCWYNTYSGVYSDDLVVFISLLQFMSQFETIDAIKSANYNLLPEYFNSFACSALEERYAVMRNKLPLDFVANDSNEYFLNQRGAKVFWDESKQPLLPLKKGENTYKVISVGFGKTGVPMVTVEKDGLPICYKLPQEYMEWVMTAVGFTNMGEKVFPGEVVFSLIKGRYYADIL